jgi:hypothetical protein
MDVAGKHRYNSLFLEIFSGVFQLQKLSSVERKAIMIMNRYKIKIWKASMVYFRSKRLRKTAKSSAKIVSNHDIRNTIYHTWPTTPNLMTIKLQLPELPWFITLRRFPDCLFCCMTDTSHESCLWEGPTEGQCSTLLARHVFTFIPQPSWPEFNHCLHLWLLRIKRNIISTVE